MGAKNVAAKQIAELKRRLVAELCYHRGVEKLIRFVVEQRHGKTEESEEIVKNYESAIYGLEPDEIKQIEEGVDKVGKC